MMIQDNPLLLNGDCFTLRWSDWYRLVTQDRSPMAIAPKPVTAEVLRTYSDGVRVFYICRTVAGFEPYGSMAKAEFTLEVKTDGNL